MIWFLGIFQNCPKWSNVCSVFVRNSSSVVKLGSVGYRPLQTSFPIKDKNTICGLSMSLSRGKYTMILTAK